MSNSSNQGKFESVWSSIINNTINGSFEYINPEKPFNEVVTSHFRNITNVKRYGVYIVRKKDSMEVLYIGKGGTVQNNGKFKKQDIPGRLKAERGQLRSNEWFKKLCEENGGLIIEYVFLGSKPEAPAFVEAKLIQSFLNEFVSLPEKNNAF